MRLPPRMATRRNCALTSMNSVPRVVLLCVQQRQHAAQKKSLKEKRQAAQEAKALKAKKAATSTTEAGRVGDRPYARGRSYKEDRYDDQ